MRSGQPLRSGSTSSMTRAIESWPAFRSPPSRPRPALVGEDQVDRTLPASCRSSVTAGATTDLAVERLHQMQPEPLISDQEGCSLLAAPLLSWKSSSWSGALAAPAGGAA